MLVRSQSSLGLHRLPQLDNCQNVNEKEQRHEHSVPQNHTHPPQKDKHTRKVQLLVVPQNKVAEWRCCRAIRG